MNHKELRQKAGLTQKQVADAVGISPATISMLENGKYNNKAIEMKMMEYCEMAIAKPNLPDAYRGRLDDFGAEYKRNKGIAQAYEHRSGSYSFPPKEADKLSILKKQRNFYRAAFIVMTVIAITFLILGILY